MLVSGGSRVDLCCTHLPIGIVDLSMPQNATTLAVIQTRLFQSIDLVSLPAGELYRRLHRFFLCLVDRVASMVPPARQVHSLIQDARQHSICLPLKTLLVLLFSRIDAPFLEAPVTSRMKRILLCPKKIILAYALKL